MEFRLGGTHMKWRFMLVTAVIILMIGCGAFTYLEIVRNVPKQLNNPPLLAIGEQTKSLKDIIFETQKHVVMISTEDETQGSGFLYNELGDLITNAHVVSGYSQVKVVTADARELVGEVIGISTETDVAVVRVAELANTGSLPLVRYEKASVGDEVISIGSPLGYQNTVTTGIVSGVGRSLQIDPYVYSDLYQISTPISHGNSGGPLVDAQTGQVLGINSAGLEYSSIGFSIPIVNVLALIEGWSKEPMVMLPGINLNNANTAIEQKPIDEMSSYLVKHFYEAINLGDYAYAYSLLTASWQETLSYVKFRETYKDVRNVMIDDEHITVDKDEANVTIVISYNERINGAYELVKQQITYRVGYHNDQLRLLSSKGKMIAQ